MTDPKEEQRAILNQATANQQADSAESENDNARDQALLDMLEDGFLELNLPEASEGSDTSLPE